MPTMVAGRMVAGPIGCTNGLKSTSFEVVTPAVFTVNISIGMIFGCYMFVFLITGYQNLQEKKA